MVHERILITVRTYPRVSARHLETVCTGGITDEGEWRRLVPVPLRYLEGKQQYRTFDVIEVDVNPGKDGRPETRTPHLPSLRIVDHMEGWPARWDWVRPTIESSLASMRAAGRTLAPVAVREIQAFEARRCAAEWTPQQMEKLKQEQLFDERKPLEKPPFDFRFRWTDGDNELHDSLILSWEMLQTFREYREKYQDPVSVMRDRWLNDLCGPTKRVFFFVGNLASRRSVYCITGVFSPPKQDAGDGLF